jgi:outer membrane protein TolC
MRVVVLLTVLFVTMSAAAAPAQPASTLTLGDVIRRAGEQRDEVAAARAAARAGEQRPTIVSALEDPMVAMSLDHVPFMGGGADVSATIEQRWPLSEARANRRAAALADLDRLRSDADRTVLDVQLEAASAFLMLAERRRTAALVDQQIGIARQIVAAANARYASGTAPQSDVLRGEVEVSRLEALAGSLAGEVRAAEAMLNASLGRDAGSEVPELAPVAAYEVPSAGAAVQRALAARPELAGARASVARAGAEVRVMQDMSRPMLSIRTGPAYTMAEGKGWMAMVGVSVPLWRDKLRAGVAEAQSMRAMSEAELRAMTRMIEGETAAAIGQAEAAAARAAAIRTDVIPRARMAVDAAMTAYAAARVPLVSVIESLQAQWSTERELVEAETQLGVAQARLARAMGSYEGFIQ